MYVQCNVCPPLSTRRFEVNFGQKSPWFKPPPGFVFLENVALHQRVRGLLPPTRPQDCEVRAVQLTLSWRDKEGGNARVRQIFLELQR